MVFSGGVANQEICFREESDRPFFTDAISHIIKRTSRYLATNIFLMPSAGIDEEQLGLCCQRLTLVSLKLFSNFFHIDVFSVCPHDAFLTTMAHDDTKKCIMFTWYINKTNKLCEDILRAIACSYIKLLASSAGNSKQ